MSVRRLIHDRSVIYFITITCREWHPLFSITESYSAVYRWFDYLKGKGHFIVGYVIMPNHLHVLIGFRHTGNKTINAVVGNGKRFMAYELIKQLTERREDKLLIELASYVNETGRKRGKIHGVFEPSFDWKPCFTDDFIEQKLNYIHENPCRGKWNLAKYPWEYLHSSAKFYYHGKQGVYPVKSFMELKDVNL